MSDQAEYVPPQVWTWNKASGGRFANINRPIAGPTHDKELPVGRHPLQVYSLATPNGVKVTVMLEELLALGHGGAEYDAWLIRINEGDQFGSGFVAANPNSQMGSAPYLGGGFGHFYAYAPTKIEYAIDRFAMEVKRQLDVLDRRLAESPYLAGDAYTIADMAVWPWYGALVKGLVYGAGEFLQVQDYTHVQRWTDQIQQRPAVQRGRKVNRVMGDPASQLHERHEASDFDTKTQDKLAPKD
jgi:GST-like protein